MKINFKILSYTFFISLMLLVCSLYSIAEEKASTQIKDIQILIGEDELTKVSLDDIKERFLKGEKVHYVENQKDRKTTIKAEWITNALKKKYGVEKIDIKNAVIIGDMDFHIKDNLVNLDESGIAADKIEKLKDIGIEKVFLISSSINIENCYLQGKLKAGYDEDLKAFVMFEKSVVFDNSTVKKVNFGTASFKEKVDFWRTSFKEKADFWGTNFKEKANFSETSFNGEVGFSNASFNSEADFRATSFKEKVDFWGSSFKEKANFSETSFNGEVGFSNASFNSEADFRASNFKEKAIFWGTSFKEKAGFGEASFNGRVDFEEISFNGKAYFMKSIFNGEASFVHAIFNDGADFSKTSFNDEANFWETSFNGKANFMKSIFNGGVDFSNSRFIGEMDFWGASFKEKANFSKTSFDGEANFWETSFNGWADFRETSFDGEAGFEYAVFNAEANFKETSFNGKAYFRAASFNAETNFVYASFNGGVDFEETSLENANLSHADMRNALLFNTNLKDAIFSGVNITGSQYEPNSSPYKGSLGGIEGLETVWFNKGRQSGLVKLRAALKESGLRDLEREATYAIEHGKTNNADWYVKWAKLLFFEWTSGYGLNYLRPLAILLVLVLVFSIPYIIALETDGKEGAWIVGLDGQARRDLGERKPQLIKLRGLPVVMCGFYFSILSAFHIRWRDLNVGSWVAENHHREYTLKATYWVRVVTGTQRLISIYLLTLWALMQFGRPFD
jgi:uncharacterized protein YjbI with pentapeptide repeats